MYLLHKNKIQALNSQSQVPKPTPLFVLICSLVFTVALSPPIFLHLSLSPSLYLWHADANMFHVRLQPIGAQMSWQDLTKQFR